jgi:hypothetical protein
MSFDEYLEFEYGEGRGIEGLALLVAKYLQPNTVAPQLPVSVRRAREGCVKES